MDKVKLIAKVHYGRVDLQPDCGLSKLMASMRSRECLNLSNAKSLVDIGYGIEYSGQRIKELDDLGAKYTDQ